MLIDNINNFSQHDSQGLVLFYTVASETANPACLMRLHESEDVVKALMGQALAGIVCSNSMGACIQRNNGSV